MLAYQEHGSGPAVVLLHGFPLAGSIWEEQMRHLAQGYRVILPDLPGHGGSAPLADPTIEGMADAVLALLDHLQIGQAAVAGHSMGGYVALAMQELAPERVAGLALVATQAGDDTPEGRAGRYALAERVGQEGPEVVVEGMLPKLFAPGQESSAILTATANLIRQTEREGIQGALHAMAKRPDRRPLLPSITAPTLVLTGLDDRVMPLERSEAMAAQIPNATLTKVARAGHMPMLEQPDEVSRALQSWLELVF